jgi:uncharacterized protein
MLRRLLLWVIRLYQLTAAPLMGPCCRFEPSCSAYAATCIERFGPLRGSLLGLKRICRCHPWGGHGFDAPPALPERTKGTCS